jgi:WD40 repeat protein
MTKLLRNRWLHRTLVVAILIALGVGIYHFEQPAPMCEIDAGDLTPHCFADGGRRIVTLLDEGTLQIWDCRTGDEMGRHFENGQTLQSPIFSKNGRRFAAENKSQAGDDKPLVHTLHLVDLVDGSALDVPLDDEETGALGFTPAGDVLARRISCNEGKELQIYDGATGRLLAKHVGKQLFLEEMTDEAVFFRTQTPAGWDLEIWSVPERRALATVPDAGTPVCSHDGRRILFERVNAKGDTTGKWAVWNMQDQRIETETEFQANEEFNRQPVISPDGRWLAVLSSVRGAKEHFVELREFPSCRLVAKKATETEELETHFSPNGRWLALAPYPILWGQRPGPLDLTETPTFEPRWSRGQSSRGWAEFSVDSRTVFLISEDALEVVACDSENGRERARIFLPAEIPPLRPVDLNRRITPDRQTTPDRRRLLVHQRPGKRREAWIDRIPWMSRLLPEQADCVVVIDTNSCRERFRLTGSGASFAMLSDDGTTLVTQHDEVLRCWDVNAYKPLYWPIGVPAGLAMLALAWAGWRRRR